ncbi:MAG: RidA family protein [Oscillospiraceae bacterium]|jgi:2-iminobutanoate/2-iminopropanoate deaminase|nr:RidA family protein [Oscillospiraceae bacterium]
MKKILRTENAPQAIGPYSQGVFCGNFLFLSGQIALTASGECMTDKCVTEQTEIIMNNIYNLLGEAKLRFDNVVKTTIFLTDINDFAAVNEVYGRFFQENAPARSTVAVAALPKGAKVEIECTAQWV